MRAQSTAFQAGFTLIEVAISLTILALLLTSVFSMTLETSHFLGDNETDIRVQLEGERVFQRFTDLLRKSGRTTLGSTSYPRVTGGGSALEFLVLADLDGNGYAFDGTTGQVEWGPTVYTVKQDAGGNVDVWRGAEKVYALGRFVTNLTFQTVAENAALHWKEIQVSYQVKRTADAGFDVIYPVTGSIQMRN